MLLQKYIRNTFIFCAMGVGMASSPLMAVAQEDIPAAPILEAPDGHVYGELWTGKLYSSKYKAGACFDTEGNAQGVLILTLKDGQEDVYHFHGTKNIQGILQLKHNSGHTFTGQFENATTIKGTVTTKNGFTVKLKGKREQNALLLGPTCRPL